MMIDHHKCHSYKNFMKSLIFVSPFQGQISTNPITREYCIRNSKLFRRLFIYIYWSRESLFLKMLPFILNFHIFLKIPFHELKVLQRVYSKNIPSNRLQPLIRCLQHTHIANTKAKEPTNNAETLDSY